MREIKDYLHLYLNNGSDLKVLHKDGQQLTIQGIDYTFELSVRCAYKDNLRSALFEDVKPILRPLSDISEEEIAGFIELSGGKMHGDTETLDFWCTPEASRYLLSKHFDLFNLIRDGLASNKKLIFNS